MVNFRTNCSCVNFNYFFIQSAYFLYKGCLIFHNTRKNVTTAKEKAEFKRWFFILRKCEGNIRGGRGRWNIHRSSRSTKGYFPIRYIYSCSKYIKWYLFTTQDIITTPVVKPIVIIVISRLTERGRTKSRLCQKSVTFYKQQTTRHQPNLFSLDWIRLLMW